MLETDLDVRDLAAEVEQEIPRSYRDLLRAANFSRGEIRELHRMRDYRAWLDFAAALATTAAVPLLYAAFPHPLTVILCVLLSIHNFNSFAQVVHCAGHGKFLSSGRLNRLVGSVAAGLLGFTLEGHALAHQIHHVQLNTDADSDRMWGRPDEPTRDIFRAWLSDIFLISACRRLFQYMGSDRKGRAMPLKSARVGYFVRKIAQNLPVIAVQAAVIAYYSVALGPEFYVYFYVLPILTIYPAQIRVRTACEHAFEANYQPSTLEERWVSRSTRVNLFERLVIAPLLIQYHFEHHLLPGVPYYNLPRARRMLAQKGLEVPLAPGYFAFLFRRWRAERRLERGAVAA
jgi:fatty acid desaturase